MAPHVERPEASSVAPRYGWFAGVLEGAVADSDALRRAAAAVDAAGVMEVDFEVDGGRFSLLFSDGPVPGERLSLEHQDGLVEALERVVAAAARPADVESTLRGSLVYDDHVIETLFSIVDGHVAPVSRRRALHERDRAQAPGASGTQLDASLARLGRRRALALMAAVLVAAALLAWQRGYVQLVRDGLFATAADALVFDTGPFGDALALDVRKERREYVCTVRRGPGYPASAAEVGALIAAATTSEERAAANAVANGAPVHLVLVDPDGATLAAAPLELGPLLRDRDTEQEVSLRARMGSARILISLDDRSDETRAARRERSAREGAHK
ncbi:MAG: hypothetical protein R3F49_13555 [Planctomycetota bacterium]